MAPLEYQYMPACEYLDRYDGITPELNVNMEYDDAVDVSLWEVECWIYS